jgi:hypothetical protein
MFLLLTWVIITSIVMAMVTMRIINRIVKVLSIFGRWSEMVDFPLLELVPVIVISLRMVNTDLIAI